MHISGTLASVAVLASSVSGLAVTKQFAIVSSTTENKTFNGLDIVSFHTGAGENAAVGITPTGKSEKFTLTNGTLGFLDGNPPSRATVGLTDATPYNSTAPAGYKLVTVNQGDNTHGFHIKGSKNIINYRGDIDFEAFAICEVNGVAPYQSVGPQKQLLWRSKTTPSHPNCANVNLEAHFA